MTAIPDILDDPEEYQDLDDMEYQDLDDRYIGYTHYDNWGTSGVYIDPGKWVAYCQSY